MVKKKTNTHTFDLFLIFLDICEENEISKLCSNVCKTVKSALRKNLVPIGCVTHGVCRHRSLLFKYLCDENDIPCRLVRGNFQDGGHAWNILFLGNQFYLVDIMHEPTELYTEEYKLLSIAKTKFFFKKKKKFSSSK